MLVFLSMIHYFNFRYLIPVFICLNYYRVEIVLDKKVFRQKYHSINKLLSVTVNQEVLNLEKMLDSLIMKINVAIKTFENKDVMVLSKCWLEILSETRAFTDFVVESYQDISKKI